MEALRVAVHDDDFAGLLGDALVIGAANVAWRRQLVILVQRSLGGIPPQRRRPNRPRVAIASREYESSVLDSAPHASRSATPSPGSRHISPVSGSVSVPPRTRCAHLPRRAAAMNRARSVGATRIALSTRTCASLCRSQSAYTSPYTHQGGPASTHCSCVNGRMQCCFQRLVYGRSTYTECGYGNVPPPACPTSNPRIDDPCGPDLQLCGFPSCCSSLPLFPGAYCDGTRWSPASSDACNSVPTGACSGQPGACTGTGFSCDCSDHDDAGILTWHCDGCAAQSSGARTPIFASSKSSASGYLAKSAVDQFRQPKLCLRDESR